MRASNTLLAFALTLSSITTAHPHHDLDAREIAEHQSISKRCAAKAGASLMARKKRSIAKRQALLPRDTSVNITIESPHYSTIQNDTCVLAPDVISGPYVWPRSETLRQDMREDQPGVPLYLDIGVLDVNTCDPAPNVMVDMWHCNATGSYSSFEALNPNTPFIELLDQLNKTISPDLDLHTGDSTWLRGMWPTDDNGVMEMTTIFPGFYVQRAIHIHVQAHTNWTIRNNGTIVSSNIASTGQLYFDEELSQQIMALEPYASHTQIERTTNDVDGIYAAGWATGWNPVVQVEALDGEDVTKGMVGYITLGVNMTATSENAGFPGSGGFGGFPSGAAPSGVAQPTGTA